jgi:hypothetical protein
LGSFSERTERTLSAASPSPDSAPPPSTEVAGHGVAMAETRVAQLLAERPAAPVVPDLRHPAAEAPRGVELANDRDLALSVEERRQLTDETDSPAPTPRALSPDEQAQLTQGEGPDVPPNQQEPADPATLVEDDQPAPRRVLSAEEQRRLRDDAAP